MAKPSARPLRVAAFLAMAGLGPASARRPSRRRLPRSRRPCPDAGPRPGPAGGARRAAGSAGRPADHQREVRAEPGRLDQGLRQGQRVGDRRLLHHPRLRVGFGPAGDGGRALRHEERGGEAGGEGRPLPPPARPDARPGHPLQRGRQGGDRRQVRRLLPQRLLRRGPSISPELLAAFKKGTTLNVSVQNQTQREVVFAVPLAGFGKSFDGPAIDPKVLEEQQKKLQAEMEKRSDEMRKKLEQQGGAPLPPLRHPAPRRSKRRARPFAQDIPVSPRRGPPRRGFACLGLPHHRADDAVGRIASMVRGSAASRRALGRWW